MILASYVSVASQTFWAVQLRKSQKHTNLPIIVKGVQSVADVELCVKAGVEGVLIVCSPRSFHTAHSPKSNHGGRQCDL